MGGGEPHAAAGDQALGLLEGGGPALEHDRAADGVALRRHISSHSTGGPGVEDRAALEPRDQLARGAGAHDHRAGLLQPRERAGVGGVNPVVAVGRREDGDVLRVAPGGRAPLERRHIGALVPERLGHEVEARGDDA